VNRRLTSKTSVAAFIAAALIVAVLLFTLERKLHEAATAEPASVQFWIENRLEVPVVLTELMLQQQDGSVIGLRVPISLDPAASLQRFWSSAAGLPTDADVHLRLDIRMNVDRSQGATSVPLRARGGGQCRVTIVFVPEGIQASACEGWTPTSGGWLN
jgi:hypothetical protein